MAQFLISRTLFGGQRLFKAKRLLKEIQYGDGSGFCFDLAFSQIGHVHIWQTPSVIIRRTNY